MADPFLDAATFAAWAKRPAWATDSVAAAALVVVSDWIRDKKPDTSADDSAAQLVTFEVARDTLLYGDIGPLSSFTKATSHSQRSGTIDRAVVEKFVTDRHRRMLGISLRAGPRGSFRKDDY